MATEFLKSRMGAFLEEIAGSQTVSYIAVDLSAKDSVTGLLDVDSAYDETPVSLPALVDFSPYEAMRRKIGLEVDMDAALMIASEHLEDHEIEVNLQDAFDLPDGRRYYVKKIVPNHQSGSSFLGHLLAVGHKLGRP